MDRKQEVDNYIDSIVNPGKNVTPEALIEIANRISRIRLDEEKILKAEAFKARKDADEARDVFEFIKAHCGSKAIQSNIVFYDCESNWKLIREYISTLPDKQINRPNLEAAFLACRSQLAQPAATPYERKVNIAETRVVPQQQQMPHKAFIGLTAQEIKNLEPSKLRKLMGKGPEYVAEINRILAGLER